jgi:AcrR family transcriptional regulator
VKEGFDALTMRRVAEQAEYSPAALYVHFEDKTTLVRELCAHDFAVFADELRTVSAVPDPTERLRLLAQRYAEFALEYPQQYRLLFLTPRPAETASLAERGNPERDAYALLEEAVAHAIERGMFSKAEASPALIAQTLWAGVHGVVALELVMKNLGVIPFEPFAARIAAMSRMLIAGVEAGRSGGPRSPARGGRPRGSLKRAPRRTGRRSGRAADRRSPS